MISFVDDYELGQHVMRELSGGKLEPSRLDPAFVERIGHSTRPALEQTVVAVDALLASWRAIPWHVRLRFRVVAWLSAHRPA